MDHVEIHFEIQPHWIHHKILPVFFLFPPPNDEKNKHQQKNQEDEQVWPFKLFFQLQLESFSDV